MDSSDLLECLLNGKDIISTGFCGWKHDTKKWKRKNRRNCCQASSLEQKLNLNKMEEEDMQGKSALHSCCSSSPYCFLSLLSPTTWIISGLFFVLKTPIAEIASWPSISVLLFSYRNRTPNMLLDTRLPRITTTFPSLPCS